MSKYLLTVDKVEGGHSQTRSTEVLGIYDNLNAIQIYLKQSRLPLEKYKVYEVFPKKLEIRIE